MIWTGLPKLVVVLLGGFTTNFLWCAYLHVRNGTAYQYLSGTVREGHAALAGAGGEHGAAAPDTPADGDPRVPMLGNYAFSALAGTIWYLQFLFYTMGETQMGRFGFASWTLHMASIIIFSTMWGWIFHEWKGAGKKTHALIALGIGTLILSTVIIGIGTWLKGQG
jgi:L-rhamnose-H+ transport protein